MTKQEKIQVAQTIMDQLGGGRFKAMTGAKNIYALDSGLQLSIPRANKINKVKIVLNSMDTYDIEFGYVHGMNYTVRATHEGIYCDQLQSIFTSETGLYTSL